MYKKIKQRTHEILEVARPNDKASRAVDIILLCLILLNVALIIADTFDLPPLAAAIIDLVSLLPSYISTLSANFMVLRMLRVLRLLRAFKLNRYTHALHDIGEVFRKKASQLISSMLVVSFLMVISSVLMYDAEHEAQPEVFDNAFSGLWWAIATVTTVGYGDIYPVTVVGRVMSAIIALLGIGLVAVPTGIITAGFSEQISRKRENEEDEKEFCPYCGKKLK